MTTTAPNSAVTLRFSPYSREPDLCWRSYGSGHASGILTIPVANTWTIRVFLQNSPAQEI